VSERSARTLILDTNLLVLLIVGTREPHILTESRALAQGGRRSRCQEGRQWPTRKFRRTSIWKYRK
jgi:hypothetical protein